MPDLRAVSPLADNYEKNGISQSGVGEEVILKIVGDGGMTDAMLNAMVGYITTSHGSAGAGDSAHTIGGVGTADGSAFEAGTTTTVFLRAQGTGDHDADWLGAIEAAGDAVGAVAFTVTIEAVFKPAK